MWWINWFFKIKIIEKHKDKSPLVEFNIGWIETYKDLKDIWGYYKGWGATIDKEKSKKYGILVQNRKKLSE